MNLYNISSKEKGIKKPLIFESAEEVLGKHSVITSLTQCIFQLFYNLYLIIFLKISVKCACIKTPILYMDRVRG